MGAEIIAGLVVAATVGLFGWVAKKGPAAVRRRREKLASRRVVLTRAVQLQLMDAIGESNLVNLMYQSPEPTTQKTMFVEFETPDGQRVWSIDVPLGSKMSDLALAARSYFKLRPFYRLMNKARQPQPKPDDQIDSCAQTGDRLALVEHPDAWGWEGKKRGRLQRMVDRLLGVRPISRLGAGGG